MEPLDPDLEATLREHFVERFIASWPERDIGRSEIEEVSFRYEPNAYPPHGVAFLEVTFRVTGSVRLQPWDGDWSGAIEIVQEIAELCAADAEYDRRMRT